MSNKTELLKYIETMRKYGTGNYTKTATFKLGSNALKDNGTVSGYFARYEKIADSYGDICKPGFLDESIKEREKTGHPFPLCFGHDYNQIIGAVASIEDKPDGAFMTAHFFDTDRAQEVRELIKCGVVYQMSFAYDVIESGPVTLSNGKKARELRKCKLYEISIVPNPAQPLSVITDIKSGKTQSRRKAELLKFIKEMKKRGSK